MEEHVQEEMQQIPTGTVIDIQSLIVPITEDSPCGEYLIYSTEYDKIRDARSEDNPNLPLGVWEHELKKADWNEVIILCEQYLTEKSKDLLIAGGLCEAATNIHGLAGLHDGLTLILQLSKIFWDTIYPRLDEDDYSSRVAPYIWLNKTLTEHCQLIKITTETHENERSFTYADWIEAKHLQQVSHGDPEQLEQARSRGKATQEDINRAATSVDNNFFVTLTQQLNNSITVIRAIEALLDEKCGKEAPGFITLRNRLEAIATKTTSWIRQDELPPPIIQEELEEEHATDGIIPQQILAPKPHAITDREAAYRILSEAADYLLTIEPHSPAPYLVKRAVSWGNMSLSELFIELMGEGRDLGSTLTLLGITERDQQQF